MNSQEMNTYGMFKTLVEHGFTEKQSEGITEAIYSSLPNVGNFVKKEIFEESESKIEKIQSDIALLQTDVAGLKTDVAGLKTDVANIKETMATKSDLAQLHFKLESDMEKLQFKMESDMEKLHLKIQGEIKDSHNDILKWIIPLFMTVIVGAIGSLTPLILQYFT